MQSRCLNTRSSGITAQVQTRRPPVSRSSVTCKAAAQDPLLLRVARGEGVKLLLLPALVPGLLLPLLLHCEALTSYSLHSKLNRSSTYQLRIVVWSAQVLVSGCTLPAASLTSLLATG